MDTAEKTASARLLTPQELALMVRLCREARKWSQEQLGAIAGLSTRTVQRVEEGQPSSLDTRRALARAFDMEDVDGLNKPINIPSAEQLKAEKEAFDRDHITLKAMPITSGRHLAGLIETNPMDLSTPGFDLPREADERFAEMVDYYREYRDCADMYSQRGKFDVYDELDGHMEALKAFGVSLVYATRKVAFKSAPGLEPYTSTALYVVACKKGQEMTEFATPKAMRLG
jgi:transcriptional regulator with XRE-family HTH domain